MRAADIERLLPEVIRRAIVPGQPLAALIAVMEDLHAPAESILRDLPAVVDPLRTPDRFVPMLARWVDLQRLNEVPDGGVDNSRMRLLVALSARLGARRGTLRGLLETLEIATGYAGFAVDDAVPSVTANGDDGPPQPFHVRITVPADAAAVLPLVRAIVEEEKPAHLTAEVVLATPGGPVPPPAGPPATPAARAAAPVAPASPPWPPASSAPAGGSMEDDQTVLIPPYGSGPVG